MNELDVGGGCVHGGQPLRTERVDRQVRDRVFNTLSGGSSPQLVAPGNGVPADATPDMPPIVRPKHSIGVATSAATIGLFIRRLTNEPSCVDGSAPGGR